jgi:hypothetical protein
VTFSVDGTVIGSGTIDGNSATFTTTALATGTHLITASYGINILDNSPQLWHD